jgi:hypothetical protein
MLFQNILHFPPQIVCLSKFIFFENFGYLKLILICAKTTQVLPLSFFPSLPGDFGEHLTRHLVVSGSYHLSLGVVSKEEKTKKKKEASNS